MAVALLAYLLTTFGYPLPGARAGKGSVAFPCQNHPCGCQTAEQCWKSCCCFTVEERWEWAKTNHVEPPDYAEKPESNGWNDRPQGEKIAGKPASAKQACSRHEHQPSKAAGSCCSTEKHPTPKNDAPAQTGVRWTMGVSARHCQGYSTEWVSSGAVTPTPLAIAWNPELPLLDQFICPDTFTNPLTETPPIPPPRSRCFLPS